MLQVLRSAMVPALLLGAVAVAAPVGGSAAAPSMPPSAGVTGTWFDPLAAGVCFELSIADGQVDFRVPPAVVDCAQPHGNEVVALLPLGDGDLPPDAAEQTTAGCAEAFGSFLGRPVEAVPAVFPFPVWPDAADWAAGAHSSACILAGSALIGSIASGALRAPGETLAAYWHRDASAELWLVDAGTGRPVRALTDDTTAEVFSPPSWTGDGSALFTDVERTADDVDVFRVPADGSGAAPLIVAPGKQEGATVSPDGTRLAYISDEAGGEFDIWVAGIDGSGGAAITDHPGRDATPRWSPDGGQVLFRRVTDGLSQIWSMAADGSDDHLLVDNGADSYDPRWSPDGTHILFSTAAAGTMDIWIADADGSHAHPLTDHPGAEEYPTWSADGRFIAFQSDRLGTPTLWLMAADGSDPSVLVADGPICYPSFSPVAAAG